MKKIFLVLVASAFALLLSAQGTLRLTPGANIRSSNGGYIVLENINTLNDGSIQQAVGDGFIKLTGGIDVSLSGGGITTIDNLLMAGTASATLNLQTNILVVSKVNFSGGMLNLNNSVLDLGTTGIFTSESEFSRATTTGSGYIQVSGIISSPVPVNLGNLGAMISSTGNPGHTIIRRGHAVQAGISGSNNSIRRFFDIIPMNNQNLKAILQFFYFDAELNGVPEPTLHQWKSKDNINWDFVGADARDMATVNANYVEKKSINKFDRTTLATASAPIFTSCPANMTVNANLPGCKASISFAATATGVPAPSITYRIGNTVITSPYVFSKGNTTVTAIATNGVAPDASCNFIVTVVCGPRTNTITSAENRINTESVVIKNKLALSATPNPSDHYFTLSVKSSTPLPFQVRIFDMLGRVVEVRSKVTPNSILFIGHNYRPGVYFVEAIQGKQIVTLKLVKQAY